MVNEYMDSINLGGIGISRNDLKLTDGTYKFSIGDFKEIEGHIENGWRFPTKIEFMYIHSIWEDLDGLGLSRNSDYWLYGEPIPHPIHNGSSWELYPCVIMFLNNMDFVNMANTETLRIRLVKDL